MLFFDPSQNIGEETTTYEGNSDLKFGKVEVPILKSASDIFSPVKLSIRVRKLHIVHYTTIMKGVRYLNVCTVQSLLVNTSFAAYKTKCLKRK